MKLRICKKCHSIMDIFTGNDINHDINVCRQCGNKTIGAHQEPYCMTYKELAEQLIFEGYFMPELSWQQYAEDLRWDWHINKEVLDQYAKECNIQLEE